MYLHHINHRGGPLRSVAKDSQYIFTTAQRPYLLIEETFTQAIEIHIKQLMAIHLHCNATIYLRHVNYSAVPPNDHRRPDHIPTELCSDRIASAHPPTLSIIESIPQALTPSAHIAQRHYILTKGTIGLTFENLQLNSFRSINSIHNLPLYKSPISFQCLSNPHQR